MIEVSREEARRIAVRAQLLDGSARGVLSTVRRLGFLQIDTVSTVAPPQHLVLYSRVGPRYDRAELDRLLWKTRKLFEADAFIYPIEDLPLVLARMRRRREQNAREARIAAFLEENAAVRRYVLRELERRGPLLSREIEDHPGQKRAPHRWWGERKMALMLMVLSDRGQGGGRRAGARGNASGTSPSAGTRRSSESRGRKPGGSWPSGACARRASASRRAVGSLIPRQRTAPFRTVPSCSPRSTGSSTTATAPSSSGTSAIASRCSSRRRNASTATTCSRCSSATGSSGGPSPSSTRRRRRSACSAPGATPPAWTRRSRPRRLAGS